MFEAFQILQVLPGVAGTKLLRYRNGSMLKK